MWRKRRRPTSKREQRPARQNVVGTGCPIRSAGELLPRNWSSSCRDRCLTFPSSNGMDSWPYDDRNAFQGPSTKPKSAQSSRDRPDLQQGMVGAVTLAEKNGRFKWSFLQTQGMNLQSCNDVVTLASIEDSNPWRMTPPFKVFPKTRAPPPRRSPFGAKLSAQHGVSQDYSLLRASNLFFRPTLSEHVCQKQIYRWNSSANS